MSGEDRLVDRDFCDSRRKDCQQMLFSKIDAVSSRVDAANARIEAVSTKVDSLKNNEVLHLSRELDDIKRAKRQALSMKDILKIVVAVLGSAGLWQLINNLR